MPSAPGAVTMRLFRQSPTPATAIGDVTLENQSAPNPDAARTLAEARARIDALDSELIRLVSERGELARRIGECKADDDVPVYAPDRESEILARLSRDNPGPLPDRVLHAIYREIMSGSLALERTPRIAFLGPLGSYSHLAATRKFGAAVEYHPVGDIGAAFLEIEREHADFAVVPVENSLGGGVGETLQALINTSLRVCAAVNLRIHHNLISRAPIGEVERVYSKPEVFEQCRKWLLETNLLSKTIATPSTSQAVEQAAREDRAAAIGSSLAAELHDLPIQVAGVEDNPNNVTRFFVMGRHPARPTGNDKTSLLFTTAHKAGALADVLNAFRAEEVNLTMITSLPSRDSAWEYYFFVDAEGHADDSALQRALAEARRHCQRLTLLGSYPRPIDLA